MSSLTVALEIRAELARQRKSQRGLARELGWKVPHLTRRLAGTVPLSVDDLEDIAAVLSVPPAKFMSDA